jgi:hypothetical protein
MMPPTGDAAVAPPPATRFSTTRHATTRGATTRGATTRRRRSTTQPDDSDD